MKEQKFGKKKSGYKGYIGNLERETKRGERKRKTVKIIKRKRRNGLEKRRIIVRGPKYDWETRLFYESCESSY